MTMSDELKMHLTDHIESWPATKSEIMEACGNMGHVDETEKKWFMDSLPEGTYASPDEVMMALKGKKEKMM